MRRKKQCSLGDTQKTDAVRRHLKDGIPVSQIANDLDVQPTMIHNWSNTALARLEYFFGSPSFLMNRFARDASGNLEKSDERQESP